MTKREQDAKCECGHPLGNHYFGDDLPMHTACLVPGCACRKYLATPAPSVAPTGEPDFDALARALREMALTGEKDGTALGVLSRMRHALKQAFRLTPSRPSLGEEARFVDGVKCWRCPCGHNIPANGESCGHCGYGPRPRALSSDAAPLTEARFCEAYRAFYKTEMPDSVLLADYGERRLFEFVRTLVSSDAAPQGGEREGSTFVTDAVRKALGVLDDTEPHNFQSAEGFGTVDSLPRLEGAILQAREILADAMRAAALASSGRDDGLALLEDVWMAAHRPHGSIIVTPTEAIVSDGVKEWRRPSLVEAIRAAQDHEDALIEPERTQ